MANTKREILEQPRLAADEIACVIPHQANRPVIENLARGLALPHDRFFMNLARHGTTSSVSIPLALDEGRRAGRRRPGALLVAFGAGLTYGAALVRW